MRFTRRDFWRGAWTAWLIFMAFLVVYLIAMGLMQSGPPWGDAYTSVVVFLVYGIPLGAVVSILVMLAGSPLAWVLGRLLANTHRVTLHVLAYAGLGAGAGTAVILIANVARAHPQISWHFAGAVIAACALSVVGGWAWSVRQSRREQ
ncbi:MAG: hypothetical protein P0Y60_11100 [Candidatus Microbacterium colombiense]|nr:MAG: hypothetical protein P0Y60_11100 [Microbacterium sp.]